jgi:hypothetical protein
MSDERKNRGWAFRTTVTLAVVLVAYPLSLVPVETICRHIFYAEGVVQHSPGLPDEGGLPWEYFPTNTRTLKGFRSVATTKSEATFQYPDGGELPRWNTLRLRRSITLAPTGGLTPRRSPGNCGAPGRISMKSRL